jgi:hypothetical protein
MSHMQGLWASLGRYHLAKWENNLHTNVSKSTQEWHIGLDDDDDDDT